MGRLLCYVSHKFIGKSKKNVMKNGLNKIKDGFFLGLGFSVPFSIFFIIANIISTQYLIGSSFGDNDIKEPNYGLSISSTRIETHDGKYSILGEITNNLETKLTAINLEAEFFDKNSKFVEKCGGRLRGELKMKDTRNFRIRCDLPVFDYDSFAVKVVDVSNF